ncbi:MAG: phosphoribosyltransferase [Desulfurococcales archaeon]|nr:phosphoribosyltransferase [Desulfurococcales archaeon]
MARVPVKLVSWDEIVEWSRGLARKIEESSWIPDLVVAVSRGGFVPARLICDFMDINDLLAVQSQHWVEAALAAERAILKYPYIVDVKDKKILVVDDIVDTGDTLELAKTFIEREWKPSEVKTAALQWISSVAKFRPDYYYIEVKDWTWFQYPWTRLEDVSQFIMRIFREDDRVKGRSIDEAYLKDLFKEWFGVEPGQFGFYWSEALNRLVIKGFLTKEDGLYRCIKCGSR